MHKPIDDPLSKHLDRNSRIEVRNTTCHMCACGCGIRVTLRNGEVRYTQGNPDHPLNKGVICAKRCSGIRKQYSPARLTKPLLGKAGSDRGDSQFEEVSWDKAFDMIEERLARQPRQNRYSVDIHGEYGMELIHEHHPGAQHAQRQG